MPREGICMDRYLFTARSVTHAQQMMRVLENAGISTKVRRASAALTQRGCGYTLEIAPHRYEKALEALEAAQVKPIKIFLVRDGIRQEV